MEKGETKSKAHKLMIMAIWRCRFCLGDFTSKEELKKHLRKQHKIGKTDIYADVYYEKSGWKQKIVSFM